MKRSYLAGVASVCGVRRHRLSWPLLAFGPAVVMTLARRSSKERSEAGALFAVGAPLGSLLALAGLRFRDGAIGPAVAIGRGNLAPPGPAQRRPPPRPQHAHHGPGRVSLLPHRFGQRVSARSIAAGAWSARRQRRLSLVAQSDQPIYQDLNSPQGRGELGFSPDDEGLLAECKIVSLRVAGRRRRQLPEPLSAGPAAVVGVPASLVHHDGFAWSDAPKDCQNPWKLLDLPGASARRSSWSETPPTTRSTCGKDSASPIRSAISAAKNSACAWPPCSPTVSSKATSWSAKRHCLRSIRTRAAIASSLSKLPRQRFSEVQEHLERTLGDYGLATETAAARLTGFAAVQNTYLSDVPEPRRPGTLAGDRGLGGRPTAKCPGATG